MNARNLFAASVAMLLLAGPASAQVAVGPMAGSYAGYGYGPYGNTTGQLSGYAPQGYQGVFGGYGGGTAAGNYLQGEAAVIQSQGQYNYLTAMAAKEAQEARLKQLENKSAYARTYWELRKFNDDRRAAERPPQATREQLAKLATIGVPKRPAEHQLDQATGIILWPEALAGDEFAAERMELEKLYGQRVGGNYGVGSPLYQGVTSNVAYMKETLKAQIQNMDPTEYVAAKKFLDSLGYEARFAPQGSVASR